MAAKDDYLIDKLMELGYVTSEQVQSYQTQAAEAGMGTLDLMLQDKVVTPLVVTTAKAAHFGAEVVNLSDMRLEDEVISAVPRHIAKRYRVVPVYQAWEQLTMAMSDPSDLDTIDSLHHLLKMDLEFERGHRGGH